MVKMKQMPEADGSKATAAFLKNGYPEANKDTVITLNQEHQRWIVQYNEASAEVKEAEKKKAEAENNLKLLVGNHEAAYIGNNVVRWPTVTSQRLDTDRLKLEQPAIYEEYLKEISSRRFSVKCG